METELSSKLTLNLIPILFNYDIFKNNYFFRDILL